MGLSQHDLGERLGVYPQQVSAWERGRGKGMTLRNMAKLCEVFGKSTEDFFTDKEETK